MRRSGVRLFSPAPRRPRARPAPGPFLWARAAHGRPYNPPMRILIANDDGYLAPGLAALVRACEGLGELDVVAPEQNASGTSNSLTLTGRCRSSSRGEHKRLPLRQRHAVGLRARGADRAARPPARPGASRASTTAPTWATTPCTRAPWPRRWRATCSAFRRSRSRRPKRAGATSTPPRAWRARGRAGAAQPTAAGPWLLNVNIPNRADAAGCRCRITRLGRRHASEPVIRADQPARRDDLLDRPGRRRARGRRGHRLPRHGQGRVSITPLQVDLTDHAAFGRRGGRWRPARAHDAPRPRFPLRLDRLAGGATAACQPTCCGRSARCTRRRKPRRRSARRPAWAWTRLRCASAWSQRLRADGIALRAGAAPRSPRCRAITSSTLRWRPRPTRTPACRSAMGQTISKPRSWRACSSCCSAARRAPRAAWAACSRSAPAAATRPRCCALLARSVVSIERLKPLHDKARENLAALPAGDAAPGVRRRHAAAIRRTRRTTASSPPRAARRCRRPGWISWRWAGAWSRRCRTRRGRAGAGRRRPHRARLDASACTKPCTSSP